MALSSLYPIRRFVISSFPRAASKRQPASLLMSGSGKVQPFFPTRRIFVPSGPSSIAVDAAAASLNSFRFPASSSASPDLSSAAPSLPRIRSPKPGVLALAESTRSFTAASGVGWVAWARAGTAAAIKTAAARMPPIFIVIAVVLVGYPLSMRGRLHARQMRAAGQPLVVGLERQPQQVVG